MTEWLRFHDSGIAFQSQWVIAMHLFQVSDGVMEYPSGLRQDMPGHWELRVKTIDGTQWMVAKGTREEMIQLLREVSRL